LAFFQHIRDAAGRETGAGGEVLAPDDRLVVFPGLELTLAVPCQALLILNADFPSSHLARLLDVLSVTPADLQAPQADNPERLGHFTDLRQLHEQLDQNAWLRGQYIVLPNVTD